MDQHTETSRSARPGNRQRGHDELDLVTIAEHEGWHVPPLEVTRVQLRPWQQAVFWGLRLYIVAMLVVMVLGFARVASGH